MHSSIDDKDVDDTADDVSSLVADNTESILYLCMSVCLYVQSSEKKLKI